MSKTKNNNNLNRKIVNEELVVKSVRQWYKKNTFGPSYRDLSKLTELSVGTVYNICHDLREAGVLQFQDSVARTIKLKKE
jgi:DNA-binding transcriptional regulator YhcF (GntR family)